MDEKKTNFEKKIEIWVLAIWIGLDWFGFAIPGTGTYQIDPNV